MKANKDTLDLGSFESVKKVLADPTNRQLISSWDDPAFVLPAELKGRIDALVPHANR